MLNVVFVESRNKPFVMSVIMMNVVMLSVMAPIFVVTNEEKSHFVLKLSLSNDYPGKPY
jgi:hypothetical protein